MNLLKALGLKSQDKPSQPPEALGQGSKTSEKKEPKNPSEPGGCCGSCGGGRH